MDFGSISHQLGQGILQTAGDGDRAAQRHAEVRELLRRQLGGGVNGISGFADDHLLGGDLWELLLHVEEETLGFTRGGTGLLMATSSTLYFSHSAATATAALAAWPVWG